MLGLARGELAMCPGEGARYEAGALGLEGMLMAADGWPIWPEINVIPCGITWKETAAETSYIAGIHSLRNNQQCHPI